MNRNISRIISLVLITAIMTVFMIPVFAESSVTYDGNAKDFIFAPDNLFSNFTDFVPGDSITQRITIDNDISGKVKIKVYVRCIGSDEKSQEFLSQMSMNIDQVGYSNLFSNDADKLLDLTEWKYLGTVYSGGDIKLDLTLNVPVEMGNDYMNAEAHMRWEFMVEELPVEPDDPSPDTSDNLMIVFLSLIAVIVAIIAITSYVFKKRTSER